MPTPPLDRDAPPAPISRPARVHRVENRFVNLWLIEEPDGLTLIDTGLPGSPDALGRTLREIGRAWREIERVLITHADRDHVGGAAEIRRRSGAPLLASSTEAAAMAEGRTTRAPPDDPLRGAVLWLTNRLMPVPETEVDGTLEPGDELPVLGGFRVLATPGHTAGHVSFWAPAHRALFAGDALFATAGALRSLRGTPLVWDATAGRASAERLRELRPRAVYCGHGPPLEGDAVRFAG